MDDNNSEEKDIENSTENDNSPFGGNDPFSHQNAPQLPSPHDEHTQDIGSQHSQDLEDFQEDLESMGHYFEDGNVPINANTSYDDDGDDGMPTGDDTPLVDKDPQSASQQYHEPKWFCCYHIYRQPMDIILTVFFIVLFCISVAEGAIIYLDNKWSHGWCVLRTHFHPPSGLLDLEECLAWDYLSLYSVMYTAAVCVVSVCATWALQLFANTRWLWIEFGLLLSSSMFALAALINKIVYFGMWCRNIKQVFSAQQCNDGGFDCYFTKRFDMFDASSKASETTLSCKTSADKFDSEYPQFVSMNLTFIMGILLMVVMFAQILLSGAALVITFKRRLLAVTQMS